MPSNASLQLFKPDVPGKGNMPDNYTVDFDGKHRHWRAFVEIELDCLRPGQRVEDFWFASAAKECAFAKSRQPCSLEGGVCFDHMSP